MSCCREGAGVLHRNARLDDNFGGTRVRKAQMTENHITRRKISIMFAAAAAASGTLPIGARAQQNYPNRPVRFVLPFAAAGVADITARVAAEKLGDKLGQRLWRINRDQAALRRRARCSRR